MQKVKIRNMMSLNHFDLQDIWHNKLNENQRIEILRNTIWQGLTDYEAQREQGDSISDQAVELNDKGFHAILKHFNGQETGQEVPSPMIMEFLKILNDIYSQEAKN